MFDRASSKIASWVFFFGVPDMVLDNPAAGDGAAQKAGQPGDLYAAGNLGRLPDLDILKDQPYKAAEHWKQEIDTAAGQSGLVRWQAAATEAWRPQPNPASAPVQSQLEDFAKQEEAAQNDQVALGKAEGMIGLSGVPFSAVLASTRRMPLSGIGLTVGLVSLGLELDGLYRTVAKPTDGWNPLPFYGTVMDTTASLSIWAVKEWFNSYD